MPIKLSIVAGLEESKNDTDTVLNKFSELCEFLNQVGYNGVELSLLEPEKINTNDICEILDSFNLEIPALGTGSTFIRFGYSLGHIDESMREKAINRIEKYIEFARETNSKVIIGLIRGRYSHDSNPKKEKLNIASSLKKCSKIAEDNNTMLVVEPINRFEIDSYNTISKVVKLVEKINSDYLKLMIDTYHTYLEEDPGFVWDYLREIKHLVQHLHLADSTRRAPGTGHFDFKTFLEIFKHAGYQGYASIETIMNPSFEDVARDSIEYLKFII